MLRLPTHAQKSENASQNDTVRHRKIPYGTVRNIYPTLTTPSPPVFGCYTKQPSLG